MAVATTLKLLEIALTAVLLISTVIIGKGYTTKAFHDNNK